MAFDRGTSFGKNRDRREFQKQHAGVSGYVFGNGIEYDATTQTISIELAANPGLEFSSGGIRIDIGQSPSILTLAAAGLNTQYITVSGSVGQVAATLTCDNNASANVDVLHAGSTGGRCKLTSTQALLGIKAGATIKNGVSVGASKLTLSAGTGSVAVIDNSSNDTIWADGTGTEIHGQGYILINPPDANTTPHATEIYGGNTIVSGAGGALVLAGGAAIGTNQNGGTVFITGGAPTGTGTSVVQIRTVDNLGNTDTVIECGTSSGNPTIGFYGKTPIVRPGTYTITAAPAISRVLNADANGGAAYTGVGTASLTDLNDLRADVASLAAVLRQLIRDLGDTAGVGLVDDTGY